MNEPADAAFELDVRFMQNGRRSVILFLPPEYHAPIGLVIAYWGAFEMLFDTCLDLIISSEASDGKVRNTAGWKRKGFRGKAKIFKEICHEWISTRNPQLNDDIISIIDKSLELSMYRNTIAHGAFSYTIPAYSSKGINVKAYNSTTQHDWPFNVDTLKELYHDISHICADLLRSFSSFAKIDGPICTIDDAEVVRIYRETIHTWNPDPQKRP